jgi:cytochrome P450
MFADSLIAGNAPFDSWRKSYEAYDNWGRYMKEMIAAKKTSILSGKTKPTAVDLIGQLVKGQAGEWDGKLQSTTTLTESEVMGNLFIFVLGGHETSASSIHFSLMFLALHPEVQRKVQHEVSSIFQGRPTSEWEFERDLPLLLNGFLGAVLNEELRLISPTITVPKITNSKPQHIIISNKEVTLPANMMIRLCIPAIHRNPHFWPSIASTNPNKPACPLHNLDNDLEDFNPDRWIKGLSTEELQWPYNLRNKDDIPQSPGLPLYTPIKGSYIPFSEGQRACLGRRFAQVEILAALATIFSRYSVELAVDEWASDEQVAQMTKDQRRVCWSKARDKADWIWRNKMGCVITLQLSGAHVPLRFVRKGEERFMDI